MQTDMVSRSTANSWRKKSVPPSLSALKTSARLVGDSTIARVLCVIPSQVRARTACLNFLQGHNPAQPVDQRRSGTQRNRGNPKAHIRLTCRIQRVDEMVKRRAKQTKPHIHRSLPVDRASPVIAHASVGCTGSLVTFLLQENCQIENDDSENAEQQRRRDPHTSIQIQRT